MEFVTLSTLPGIIGRYLMMLKVTDILDIAIMVFVFYKALTLIQSTRAASLLKGVLVFLAALMLSMVLNMNSINFIMNQLVRWGVVALIVLFQPEIGLGVAGILPPATSAMLHNLSTLGVSLHSMSALPQKKQNKVF